MHELTSPQHPWGRATLKPTQPFRTSYTNAYEMPGSKYLFKPGVCQKSRLFFLPESPAKAEMRST